MAGPGHHLVDALLDPPPHRPNEITPPAHHPAHRIPVLAVAIDSQRSVLTARTVVAAAGRGSVVAVVSPVVSDRTLVLLKPDAVERGLVGTILGRFEAKGLRLVALDLRTLDDDTLSRHYAEHVGKPFYPDLVAFMGRGPVVALVLEGPENTWEVVRTLMGPTNPRNAAPGTIAAISGSSSRRTSSTAAIRSSRQIVRSRSSSRISNIRRTRAARGGGH